MKILVVDDDPHIRRTLEILLSGDGHAVHAVESGEAALERLEEEPVNMALLDLQLPGIDGDEVLRRIRDAYRGIEVVIITAHGTIETAVACMKEGAFDYLTKPFSPDQVRHRVAQVAQVHALRDEVAGLRRRLDEQPLRAAFVTQNPAALELLELARSVADSDATVLIQGESGTGKTLLARAIHEASGRASGPFAVLDCTSIQESLLESELFGHRKGAFTGAVADKPGKVEGAEGGTLFLDEVGEVPLHLQSKLLRLVEDKTYERVGDPKPRKLDARIVAATHRDLDEMAQQGEFRQDLFYRLGVVDLALPALRARPEDVLLLTRSFLGTYNEAHGKQVSGWSEEVEQLLLRYSWPGNVRELAHTIERAVLLAPGRILRPEHLSPRLREARPSAEPGQRLLSLAELEEAHIRRTLEQDMTLEEAARVLGINPSTLWRKRKRYGI